MTTPIRSSRSLTMLAAGIYGIGLMSSAVKAQTISVVGPIAGGGFSRAYAVNSSGTVVAGYSDNALGQDVAIRWTSAGGSVSMGLLPGGSTNSYGQGIDSTGNIIVGYGDSGGITRAFRWTNTGGYQILPFASGTSGFNKATGISADGSIVAGVSGLGGAANGFNWYANNPTFPFNMCAGLGAGNTSIAVSADGSAMAGVCGNTVHRRTYFPNSVGGSNSVPGQMWSMGEAISGDGLVITGRYGTSGGAEMGFRWSQTQGPFMTVLPQTPNGCTALRPRAVNGDGSVIIGQVVDNVAGFTCFVWTPAMGSRLLTEHLQLRAVNLTGWTLTDATGISPDGSAMCGHGIYNGSARGWVARGLPCANLNGPLVVFGTSPCVGGQSILTTNFSFQVGTAPFFRWWKDGVPIVAGTQPSGSTIVSTSTNQLTINNMQFGDAGNYRVAISAQGACEVASNQVALAGPSVITPVTQPTDTIACQGQNPFLFCAASSVSAITYKWQRLVTPPSTYANINDGPTGNGSTYFGTNTTTFSIFNSQGADTNRYRCVWSFNGCGPGQNVISSNRLLTVIDSLPAVFGPYDTSGCPGNNDAYLGVSASPCVGCTYQWQKFTPCPFINCFNDIYDGPTGNGGSYGGAQTPNLVVAGLYPGDFTQYRCIITMPCAGAVASGEATISASPAPTIAGPTGGEGCENGSATLSVTAAGGTTYQWQQYVGPCILCYVDVANGPTGNGGTYAGAQSPNLTINGLDLFDTFKSFRCVVTNGCGNGVAASADAFYALQSQPLIQTQPVGGIVCRNGTRQLSIAVAPGNYGPVTYQWWRYTVAGPIFAPVGNGLYVTGSIAAGAQTTALTISNFQSGDTGQYYCAITGTCATTFSTVVNMTHCPADFNCSGATTIQDIFDFLAAWFAGNPSANFNGVGGITIQDIFDFLAAWFAGCGG